MPGDLVFLFLRCSFPSCGQYFSFGGWNASPLPAFSVSPFPRSTGPFHSFFPIKIQLRIPRCVSFLPSLLSLPCLGFVSRQFVLFFFFGPWDRHLSSLPPLLRVPLLFLSPRRACPTPLALFSYFLVPGRPARHGPACFFPTPAPVSEGCHPPPFVFWGGVCLFSFAGGKS